MPFQESVDNLSGSHEYEFYFYTFTPVNIWNEKILPVYIE